MGNWVYPSIYECAAMEAKNKSKRRLKPIGDPEKILQLRCSVKTVLRYFDSVPRKRRYSAKMVREIIADWLQRDSAKADHRHECQEQSRKRHPTFIASPEDNTLPDGVDSITIKVRRKKDKQ